MHHVIVSKGAPEVMQQFISDCPANYVSEYKRHANKGARVITLAVKHLPATITTSDIKKMHRSEVRDHCRSFQKGNETVLKVACVTCLKNAFVRDSCAGLR